METLRIEPTSDTPRVVLDASGGIFELSERCFPEDATQFFSPILEWVKNYSQSPNAVTEFNFKLEYYNTASSKQLFKLFVLLHELSQKHQVVINWYYSASDTDMLSSGERYSKLLNFPFNMKEVE
ncbi:MAG: DUF1987 domain-containing protein [Bacteroidia bacterium]|jgi:hypothetical protein